METGLAEKVVLVTGGAGGIGKDICRAFSNEGSKVIIHYNSSKNSAEELASEIGGIAIQILSVSIDLGLCSSMST